MSRSLVAASAALSVASLGVALWALQENAALRTEVRGSPAAPAAAGVVEERLEGAEAAIRELRRAVGAEPLPASDSAGMPGAGSTAGDPAGGAAAGAPPAREPLRSMVRELLQEEIRRREEEAAKSGRALGGDEKKPPLSQFAAELELEPGQREGVRLAVLEGQEKMIALLRTPTTGGRVPMDDLLGILMGKPEEAQPRMIEFFGMLTSETVPGSTETYAVKAEGLKSAAVESFRREFTPEQFQAFEKMGQDPLEIEIPDSPWIGVLQEAYRRRK